MNDQNKKTLRQFQCRDYLWEIFEQMSGELECSVDYLINEAMRQYARSRNYGARTGPAPEPTGQRSIRNEQPTPGAPVPRPRVPSQPAIPSAPPPPPSRGSYPQQGHPPPSYAQHSPAPQAQPAYPAPPGRSSPGGYPAPAGPQPGSYPQQPQGGYGAPQQGGYPAPPSYPQQPQGGYGAPQQGGYPAPPSYPQQPQGGYGAPPPRSAPSSYPPPPQTTRPPSLHGAGGPPPLQQQAYAPAPPPLPTGGASHPPGMATLFVIFNGQKFPVNKEEFIIGRGTKTADLAIKDGNISRRHAAIIYQNGGFYMKDLGSTNGVEYQGRRVDGRRIEEGDVYQLCDYELRFTYR